jgi:predicted DsbA family dithiol-disulfide isomerase
VIEVFADVCCPFTHVGLRRITARRVELGLAAGELVLRVRSWPLELVNGHPLDATFIAEEVEAIREQVAPDLFTGFDPARFPGTSVPALALAHAAYDIDDATGERVSLALRDELFERGHDIADPVVLAELAAAHGVMPPTDPVEAVSRVMSDWEAGRALGVVGSPHFFAMSGDVFCPSLDIKRVDGQLVIRADHVAIDAFLDQCLAT